MKRLNFLVLLVFTITIFNCINVFAQPSLYSKGIIYTKGTVLPNGEISPGVEYYNTQIVYDNPNGNIINQTYNVESNLAENTIALKSLESFNNGQKENIGIQRLAYIIGKQHNESTKSYGNRKLDNTHYQLDILSTIPWALGTWDIEIVPDLPQNQVAPKGGYWYGYYNDNSERLGICWAKKHK